MPHHNRLGNIIVSPANKGERRKFQDLVKAIFLKFAYLLSLALLPIVGGKTKSSVGVCIIATISPDS